MIPQMLGGVGEPDVQEPRMPWQPARPISVAAESWFSFWLLGPNPENRFIL